MGNRFQAPMKEVTPAEQILLSTEFREGEEGGYIAKCVVNGQPLATRPNPESYLAINHLIGVVVEMKKKEGKTRDVEYIFTTKLK